MEKASILAEVCQALLDDHPDRASELVRSRYPFEPVARTTRRYGPQVAVSVFLRDGFVDRYSGRRLVFAPALRLISLNLPVEFPFHPHWKMDETHLAYWELAATIDHVDPVTRGGSDDESNLVTTSMLRNSAKTNWTLSELDWSLHPPGDVTLWDGLTGWFVRYLELHPESLNVESLRQWYRALVEEPT